MFLEIIEDLYEGTLDPIAWDRAILRIADSVRADGAMLFAFNPSDHSVLRDENHRVDPQTVQDYARHWTYEDIRFKPFLDVAVGQPATEVSLGIPGLKQSSIYNEFLVPVNLPHFMPVWLHKSEDKAVALSLLGSRARGGFESRDIETIRHILPHLARALEIRDRLEAVNVRAANFANILDATNFGVIVLNNKMQILDANAVASALLLQNSYLQRDKDGTLKIGSANGNRAFQWTREPSSSSAADALMHVPREGKLPLSILVTPVSQPLTSWVSGDPAWVLLVFDAERQLGVNEQLIAKDLGLSQRESEATALLASGLQIEQIAKRMHVSVHTVRSQLKAVFHKTGCHSQAALVRRLLLGPGAATLT
jgi:DNA-binding CsgD family transcriptional regulator/PAS domain-containing protein